MSEIVVISKEELRQMIRAEVERACNSRPATDSFLTVQEAAEVMRCSADALYRKKNRIGYAKDGSRVVFRLADIQAYMSAKKIATQP